MRLKTSIPSGTFLRGTVEGATAWFGESRLPHGDERRAAPEAGFVEVDGTEVVRIPFVVQTTKPPIGQEADFLDCPFSSRTVWSSNRLRGTLRG